jgi:hypothetical protein
MAKKLEQKNIQTNQQKGKTFLQKYHANKLFRCIETQLGEKNLKFFF